MVACNALVSIVMDSIVSARMVLVSIGSLCNGPANPILSLVNNPFFWLSLGFILTTVYSLVDSLSISVWNYNKKDIIWANLKDIEPSKKKGLITYEAFLRNLKLRILEDHILITNSFVKFSKGQNIYNLTLSELKDVILKYNFREKMSILRNFASKTNDCFMYSILIEYYENRH